MAALTPVPKIQFFDANGQPLVGGKLYSYAAGTTVPLSTYVDQGQTATNTNPVIMDARGEASVWLDSSSYKLRLTTADDVDIWTVDNITAAAGGGGSSPNTSFTVSTQTAAAGQTVFTLTNSYIPGNQTLSVYVNGLRMVVNVDYTETSSTTVTFTSGLTAGDEVTFLVLRSLAIGTADSANVSYTPAGANAVVTSVQAKLRETVSVKDFGAVPGTDMSTALQNAVNALPAAGGEIVIGPGAWVLNTNPTVGTKSIVWSIDPAATWSGTGVGTAQFLSMATNPNQLAAGTHIRSQSTLPTPSLIGGIGAFSVEMLQPSTYNGSSVALYAGASSASSQAVADVWAINGLVKALAGATGIFQCAELDVDTYASGATTKGIGLNGVGNYNATVGVEIQRADATKWAKAIHILNSLIGIQIEPAGLNIGLLVNGPVVSSTAVSVGQLANNVDAVLISRNTNSTPTGFYVRCVNADNSSTIFSVDVSGNVNSVGNIVTSGGIQGNIVAGANLRATTGAVSGGAGTLALGSTTSATASAGAQTLPANPLGFLEAYIGATLVKIPYYAA